MKWIVSDLDGTLLGSTHRLDEETVTAIKDVQAKGYEFIVATGRTPNAAIPMFQQWGIECKFLVMNGAMFLDEQQQVKYAASMDQEILKKLMRIFEEKKQCYYMYEKEHKSVYRPHDLKMHFVNHMMKQAGLTKEEVFAMIEKDHFCDYDFEITSVEDYFKQEHTVYKVELYIEDDETLEMFRKQLSEIKEIALTNSIGNNIEITMADVNKGSTLEKMCAFYHVAKEECLVFGDSLNDYEMMRDFPYSVAVKNAHPKILEVANYQIGSNEENSVAKAMQTL